MGSDVFEESQIEAELKTFYTVEEIAEEAYIEIEARYELGFPAISTTAIIENNLATQSRVDEVTLELEKQWSTPIEILSEPKHFDGMDTLLDITPTRIVRNHTRPLAFNYEAETGDKVKGFVQRTGDTIWIVSINGAVGRLAIQYMKPNDIYKLAIERGYKPGNMGLDLDFSTLETLLVDIDKEGVSLNNEQFSSLSSLKEDWGDI